MLKARRAFLLPQVRAVSRTPGIWTDARTLKVQYQLFDILGRSQVQLEDLAVTATIDQVPPGNNVFPCALPSAITGDMPRHQ